MTRLLEGRAALITGANRGLGKDIAIEYVTANSPVDPAVEGRIVGP